LEVFQLAEDVHARDLGKRDRKGTGRSYDVAGNPASRFLDMPKCDGHVQVIAAERLLSIKESGRPGARTHLAGDNQCAGAQTWGLMRHANPERIGWMR
jgi:hypothetical protein